MAGRKPWFELSLAAVFLLGLTVRIPGVFWGYGFPTGWHGHHVDEYTHLVNAEALINPKIPPRWDHPYPKAMAAHVAAPLICLRLLEGQSFDALPSPERIVVLGRLFSVVYGTLTVLLVFLLAQKFCSGTTVPLLASLFMALGGLHVSQSHFFLADVATIFWTLLASYLLLLHLTVPTEDKSSFLLAAAACVGIAFGLKLALALVPSLLIAACLSTARIQRVIETLVFFLFGFSLINVWSYTPSDLLKTLLRGTRDPHHEIEWWSNLGLYLIEFPSLISFPVALLALVGVFGLLKKLLASSRPRSLPVVLVVVVPCFIQGSLVLFKLDHFLRHLLPLLPWFCIAAAWALARLLDKWREHQTLRRSAVVFVTLYLLFFVFDGERVFLIDPRYNAARWILGNVPSKTSISWITHGPHALPDYRHLPFPNGKAPPTIVVAEMLHANHFLSGSGFRDSYPSTVQSVFGSGGSEENLKAWQALFRGNSEYVEVARFKEGYFMPEYLLVDHLLGNRSRNYVSEIVIFADQQRLGLADESW